MRWSKVCLDTVLSALESGTRPKGGASSDRGDVPSLGGENILSSGGVTLEGVRLVPAAFHARMTKGHLQNGDVLINKDGAQTGKVGWYQSPGCNPACINEHLFLLRGIPDKITQGYLYYTLLSEAGQNQIWMQISGSAQPGLKSNFVTEVVSEIPSDVNEQTKIVEVLSTVDRAIEQTGALITKQQCIKTGLMQDLLKRGIDEHSNLRSEEIHQFKDSPMGRIPVEWECERFGTYMATSPQNGIYKPQSAYTDSGVPIVRIDGFRNGDCIDNQSFKCVSLSARDTMRYGLEGGDLLVNRVNSIDYLGKSALVGDLPQATVFESNMMRVRVDPRQLLPDFAIRVLSSPAASRLFQRLAKIAIAQASINQQDVCSLWMQRPCIEEQARIVQMAGAVDDVIGHLSSLLRKLKRMKMGLMQDLLTGNVRVTPLLSEPQVACA